MQILSLVLVILTIIPLWRICSRAGFHGALSLVAIIPLIGPFVVGAILSFATWAPKQSARGG